MPKEKKSKKVASSSESEKDQSLMDKGKAFLGLGTSSETTSSSGEEVVEVVKVVKKKEKKPVAETATASATVEKKVKKEKKAKATEGLVTVSGKTASVPRISENFRYTSQLVNGYVSAEYMSEVEQRILKSDVPVELESFQEVTVLGQKGALVNSHELSAFNGDLDAYEVAQDSNPEIVVKRCNQNFEYVRQLAVKYLKPPTPKPAGDIIITREADIVQEAAPPLVVRQQQARPVTPTDLVFREAPPVLQECLEEKHIVIPGRVLPAPPRRVVVEKLAAEPAKPQNLTVERWLAYPKCQRRVIFNNAQKVESQAVHSAPRNKIIQWDQCPATVTEKVSYEGVVEADPEAYVENYGSSLLTYVQLPEEVRRIKNKKNIGLLSADDNETVCELVGDLHALQYINLEEHGLGEYRQQLLKLGYAR